MNTPVIVTVAMFRRGLRNLRNVDWFWPFWDVITTLRHLLMPSKDPLPNALKSDVVYGVDRKECNVYYFGETWKTLQSRMPEHQGVVRRRETTSHIWMHTTGAVHSFDFAPDIVAGNRDKFQPQGRFKIGIVKERVQIYWRTKYLQ